MELKVYFRTITVLYRMKIFIH